MPYLTPQERVGTIVADRYRVDRVIGRGGMGVVFHAVHTWTEREVALKVLLPQYAGDEEVVARFLQEAKAAASLKSPHVVDVLDMGRSEDGALYLALELLDGIPLGGLLPGEPVPVALAFGLVLPLLDALGGAHARGIVHRDLKPDNIFVARAHDGSWVPKLLDFGIAKLAEASDVATGTGVVLGTPRYMAPEQASGARVGPATDVWAMGTVLYELLSGETPFEYESNVHLLVRLVSEDAPSLARAAPAIDPRVVEVVDRAIVRDVGARWPDARAFVDALRAAMREAGIEPSLDGIDAASAGESVVDPTRAVRGPKPTVSKRAAPRPDVPSEPTPPDASVTRRSRRRVLVVRPYGLTIRSKVFPLFEAAGLELSPDDVIAPKTPDDEAMRRVRTSDATVLLVPYHGHKDEQGNAVNGLAFVRRLHATSTEFRWRVVMPVSAFARASVTLALGGGQVPADLVERLLFLYDDELDAPDAADRIARHVQPVIGAAPASA